MDDHRIELDSGWSLWRWLCLRSTGFPIDLVDVLAGADSAAAADQLNALGEALDAARGEALAELRSAQRSKRVNRAIKALEAGTAPPPCDELTAAAPALASVTANEERHLLGERALLQSLARENHEIALALAKIAGNERFREALLWQNRKALHGSVASMLRRAPQARDAKTREKRRLVATYLQRYCVKNETIGFFGPVGWGTINEASDAIQARAGATLLDRRSVFFEHWAIQTLADRLSESWDIKPWLSPRLMPTLRVEGTTLLHPIDKRRELPLEFARTLAACDGVKTAKQIANALVVEGHADDEADVYALLTELENKGIVTWQIEVPTMTSRPEICLRERLEEIAGDVAKPGLAALDEIEACRTRVAEACGNVGELDDALGDLEASFERLTRTAATRNAGLTYAGRTLVYEDCRRNIELSIGPELLRRLGPPLSAVLASARWYTHRVGELYRNALEEAYAALSEETGAATFDYQLFWSRVSHHFPGTGTAPLVQIAAGEVQRRWVEILGLGTGVKRLSLPVETVADACRKQFAAPHPGWPSARYHSPDCLIAASSTADINRGDFVVVLGEVHVSVNSCGVPVFQNQHDTPSALARAREADLPDVMIAPVIAKELVTRADHIWSSSQNVDLEVGTTRSLRPRSQVIAVGSAVVERRDGRLVVRDRDSARVFDIIEFFDHHLTVETSRGLPMLPPAKHAPRVTVGDLVMSRETWRFDRVDIDFADETSESTLFSRARGWANRHRLPRRVFVKVPEEIKPVYIDLASPTLIELLAKLVRRTTRLTVSEMLPLPEHCWLRDADERRYSSELRLVALDPKRWQRT